MPFRFNCKRTFLLSAISLTTFFIGVGFSNSWQLFNRKNEVIIETTSKVENIPEMPKIRWKEPRFDYTCEEINNYCSYKAPDKRYVEGGVLNGKSCFVEPVYPKKAIEDAISGQINVEVLVDGLGVVRSAKAISGSELLKISRRSSL